MLANTTTARQLTLARGIDGLLLWQDLPTAWLYLTTRLCLWRHFDNHEAALALGIDVERDALVIAGLAVQQSLYGCLGFLWRGDRGLSDALDDIAATQSCIGRRRVGIDTLDHDTLGILDAKLLRQLRC